MAGSARAIEAGRAYFQLFADNSELIAGLRNAEAAVSKFIANVQVIGARIGNLGYQMFLPINDLISAYAKFDDQMRITAAVTGSTERVYRQLSQTAMQATKALTFKPVEAAGAMAQLGKAGFSSQEIEDSTLSVMQLARATGVSLPEATQIASTVMRTFNMNSKQMGNVVDVMTASANTAMQSVTDLAEALSYAGPIAAQVGMDIKETAKAVSVMANFGIRGSRAGTAMRQMLSRLGNSRVQGLYKELGVEVTDAAGRFRGLGSVLVDVGKALAKLPDMQRLNYLTKMFGMYGMAGGAILTAHGFDTVADAIDNCDGVAQKTAERMDAGIGGFLRRLSTTANRLGVIIGKVAAPAFMRWNTTVGLTGEILERLIRSNGRIIRGILNIGGALIAAGGGFLGSVVAMKGFSAVLAAVRMGITPAVRAVNLIGRSFGGLVSMAGKGIGALRSIVKGVQAFSLTKFSLKNLTPGNVGAGMMGFGAVLHVLSGNAKEVKKTLESLGEAHPAIAKITGALSGLIDKFGIGSNAIRKLSTVIAMFGGGMVVLPALMRFGDGISRITKAVGGLVGATKNNVFGSLYKFGAASLAAGTAFRLLDGNLWKVRESLVSFGAQVPIASGACAALVRVLDRMNTTAATFGKKADFFNKLGGLALAIRPLQAATRAVAGFGKSVATGMSGVWGAGTRAMLAFVRTVDRLGLGLGNLLRTYPLIGILTRFGVVLVTLATIWRVSRGSVDKLAEAIRKLKDTFPELSGVIDFASASILKFGKIVDSVLYFAVSLGKAMAEVSSQILGVAAAFTVTYQYFLRTHNMAVRLIQGIAPIVGMAVRAIAGFFTFGASEAIGTQIQNWTASIVRIAGALLYVDSVLEVFKHTFQAVTKTVYGALSGQWLANIINKIIGTVSKAVSFISDQFNQIVKVIQNAVGQFVGSFGGGLFGDLFNAVDDLLEKLGDLFRAIFGIAKSGKGLFADLGSSLQEGLQNVFAGVRNTVQRIVDFVKSAVTEIQGIVQLAFAGFRAGQVEKTIAYLFAELQLKAVQIYVFVRESIVKIAGALADVGTRFVARLPDITQAFVAVVNQMIAVAETLTKKIRSMLEDIRYKAVNIAIDVKYMILQLMHDVEFRFKDALHSSIRNIYDSLENLSLPVRLALGIDQDEMHAKRVYHGNEAIKARMRVGATYVRDIAKKEEKDNAEHEHRQRLVHIDELQFTPFEYDSKQVQDKLQKIINALNREIFLLEKNWSEQNQSLLAAKIAERDQAKAELQERVENHETNQDYKNTIKDRREAAERRRDTAEQRRKELAEQRSQAKQRLDADKETVKQTESVEAFQRQRYLEHTRQAQAQYGEDRSQWPEAVRDVNQQLKEDYQRAHADTAEARRNRRVDQQALNALNDEDYVQREHSRSARQELKQIAKDEKIYDQIYRDNPEIQESEQAISDLDQQMENFVAEGGSEHSGAMRKMRAKRRREVRKLGKMQRRRDRLERKYGLQGEQQAEGDYAMEAQAEIANPVVNIKNTASSVGTFDPAAARGFDNAYWYKEQTQKQTDILTDIRDYAQSIDTALNEESSVAWL